MTIEGVAQNGDLHPIQQAFWGKHGSVRILYDESGQLVTSSFKDYCAPSAADFPKFEVDYVDTPSLTTPWGARGVGEGGGSPLIVVSSAVSDALEPFNVEIKGSHVTSEDILQQLID